jgi:hypothetical protein
MYTAETAKAEADYHNDLSMLLKEIDRKIYQAATQGQYDVVVTVPEESLTPILTELLKAHYTYNSVLRKQFAGNGILFFIREIHIFWGKGA